ncbi:hypothetical protein QTP88_003710 [Uroleucon formosanum]
MFVSTRSPPKLSAARRAYYHVQEVTFSRWPFITRVSKIYSPLGIFRGNYGGVSKRASVVQCKCTNMTKLRIACRTTYSYLYILQCLPLENILRYPWTLMVTPVVTTVVTTENQKVYKIQTFQSTSLRLMAKQKIFIKQHAQSLETHHSLLILALHSRNITESPPREGSRFNRKALCRRLREKKNENSRRKLNR